MRYLGLLVCLSVVGVAACGDDDGAAGSSGSAGAAGSAGYAGFVGGGSGGVGGTAGDGGSSGTSGTGGTSGVSGSSGSGGSAGTAGSAGGTWAVPTLPFEVTPGAALDTPNNQWTFVAFPDAKCANGTSTGIAVNTVANPQGLLIFMQGGGACWDAQSCLVLKSSVHLEDNVSESVVLSEAEAINGGLFDHSNALNPFRQYAYVYMPYCTGDLHSGTRAETYNAGAGDVTIEHHGGLNVEAYLKRLVPTYSVPGVGRVVVSGISAGGFGATLNWWRYQGAFPNARVDVLDDAGLLVDAPDTRWMTMNAAWGMVQPPGCSACANGMSGWLPFYAQHMVAPRRYGLMGFTQDGVIAQYFGLSGEQIETQLLALRANAAANQKMFFLSGSQHSVIGEGGGMTASDGATALPWILQFAGDDPTWNHAGP